MDTDEINAFVQRECRSQFQGVYSIDNLPTIPRLLVCNTDPSYMPGRHWIAIYVSTTGYGEYFDSFGLPPNPIFEHYMNVHCRNWTFNTRCLQNLTSSFCGFYCCFYCILRCRGFNLARIVRVFTRDTTFNDFIVYDFVCNGIPSRKLQFLRSKYKIG